MNQRISLLQVLDCGVDLVLANEDDTIKKK
jgi:hypothetical protein